MVDGQFPAMARVNYTPLGKIRESSGHLYQPNFCVSQG
jgi:hypothetical protein